MADEARAMLDALMGGDRNAPLEKQQEASSNKRKRQKSCYDANCDPLYCAWNGVDVYELFVNTKSDLGPNPKVPSKEAQQEYQSLPKHEQERLGFEFILFRKLQDLVQQCDRTVGRSKEKLRQELSRQQKKRGASETNYVTSVDPLAVESIARLKCQVEDLETQIVEKVNKVSNLGETQEKLQAEVDQQQEKKQKTEVEEATKANTDGTPNPEEGGDPALKSNETSTENDKTTENSNEAAPETAKETTKEEENKQETNDSPMKEGSAEEEKESSVETDNNNKPPPSIEDDPASTQEEPKEAAPTPQQEELRRVTLERQRLLFDVARHLQQYTPLQENALHQTKQLCQVKSDISTDKTVCEISGNFMSARDADERIAAHYAGKQYVGWKLVRDKYAQLLEQYGRQGPPRGSGAMEHGRGGYEDGPPRRDYGGGDRYGPRGGPDRWERGGGGDRRYGGGGGGRGGYGGGGGHYGGGGDRRYGGRGGGRGYRDGRNWRR